MQYEIGETLDSLKGKSREEQSVILKRNDSKGLRYLLKIQFDDKLEFNLPEGDVPLDMFNFKKYSYGKAPATLESVLRGVFIFMKDGRTGSNTQKEVREKKFIHLLGSLCLEEREYMIELKDKKLDWIEKKAVEDAFPGLIDDSDVREKLLGR